jgi:hypothetical protein
VAIYWVKETDMATYTTTLTEAEDTALAYVAFSQDDWIQNAVHNRCRIAIDEIITIAVEKCLEEGITLPNTKDAIVMLAVERGWIKTAAQRHDEAVQQRG